MAKHLVKCPYCNETFDASQIEFIQVGRRYAHKTCYDAAGGEKTYLKQEAKKQKTKEESSDLANLKSYISVLYGSHANWPLIMKQIKDFQKKGYSLTGIEKSLRYFYEVKHNKPSDSNGGIGIVEFCFQDAYNYYLAIFLANQQNENKNFIQTVKEYSIRPPKMRGTKQKLFDLGGEDEE